MEDGSSTDSLRTMAPKWSLAGDDRLLNLLQNTHQRIISQCEDVNSKLEAMALALDDATIDLQNVNNKFMALSNSQFIESRVYDDDVTDAPDTQPGKELPQERPVDEVTMIKNSLAILERAHETAEILDDSDSDSDYEISVVLKPRDMYAERPLPHIIGSQAWKNKWHAGLIVEESDSDSCTSKHDVRDIEQFSDSESEVEQTSRPRVEDHTISESGSSFNSEHPIENTPPVKQKPADIAAELARRLGGPTQIPVQEPEKYSPPVPTTRKVYKPEQPATSTIFSDEPPPLDTYEPEELQSEDDDIFAEINKNKPYTQKRNTVQNNLAEDLFSFDKPYDVEQGDIFSDFAPGNVETKPATRKSTLFKDESEPELFAEPIKKIVVQDNENVEKEEEPSPKKPVGGISLFGSNKSAESIGAAILQRNRRKSSTSGEESGSDNVQIRNVKENPKTGQKQESLARNKTLEEIDNKHLNKSEKDIFDDLFAKSEKKPAQKIAKEVHVKVDVKKSVKDLFSDNIFDDIDDIFTSNVKIPEKDLKQKSIFDDDDDLFSDIAKPKSIVKETKVSKDNAKNDAKKSMFDSDDDLFSDVKNDHKSSTKNIESQKTLNRTDSIVKTENNLETNTNTETTKERNLFDDSPQSVSKTDVEARVKTKGIFDSDSDEDIFANINRSKDMNTNESENNANKNVTRPVDSEKVVKTDSKLLVTETVKSKGKSNVFESPSLFEEEEIDDLFINANKSLNKSAVSLVPQETETVESKSIPSVVKETTVNDLSIAFESKILDISNEGSEENLPKVLSKSEQKVLETSVPISIKETDKGTNVFDNNIQEVDLFYTNTSKHHMPNIRTEIVPTDVIETSQEVNILIAKTQNVSKAGINVENMRVIENNENDKIPVAIAKLGSDTEKQGHSNQSVFNDFIENVIEKEVVTSKQYKTVLNEPSIFDDIFTEPPAFEKPSEPKKSKNVNALFDDDSDDESLFFKKSDVISDEKPEIFSKNANFGIFVNEPPAIDVDFSAEAIKNVDLDANDDDLFSSVPKNKENFPSSSKSIEHDKEADLFTSMPAMEENLHDNLVSEVKVTNIKRVLTQSNSENKENNNLFTKGLNENLFSTHEVKKHTKTDTTKGVITVDNIGSDSDDELFSSLPKPNIPKSSLNKKSELNETNKSNERGTVDDLDDNFQSVEPPKQEIETKKIGKINTKNFNINVNALIPGASPKKVSKEPKDEKNVTDQEDNVPKMVKIKDETDNLLSKSPTNKTENEQTNKNKVETCFEEKAESGVLDNNASKQRAKIQVKRRPSTRRARHEAVRKSAIDFGDDTDNSSSFDEPVKPKNTNSEEQKKIVNIEENGQSRNVSKDSQSIEIIKKTDTDQSNDAKPNKSVEEKEINASESIIKTSDIDTNIMPVNSNTGNKNNQNNTKTFNSNEIINEPSITNDQENKNTTTKVVYILNDEDIFNTTHKNTERNSDNDILKTRNIETKSDNILDNKALETNSDDDIFKSIDGVKTLGKTYKDNTKEPLEVIKKDINYAKIIAGVNKKHESSNSKDAKTQPNAKTSLFDESEEELFNESKKVVKNSKIFDSDSEDDLFSGKKRTEKESKERMNQDVKKKEVKVKGSLFGDDSDDDLFGVKKEKSEPKSLSSIPSTSKEAQTTTASKTVEPVFDDPLSMLGDDD